MNAITYGMLWLALAGAAQAQTAAPVGQTYTPGPFDKLEIAGAATVRLSQGERDSVFIAGDEKVQKGVEVSVSRQKLTIAPSGGWKFWNSQRLQVDVVMRDLRQLVISGASDLHAAGPLKAEQLTVSISGAGQARFDDLAAEQLRFHVSGAGEGQMKGRVEDLQVQISGKGKLLAEELQASRGNLSISGIGQTQVWVTDELKLSVSGIGNVDYWGRPRVTRSTSGMANVTAHGDKK